MNRVIPETLTFSDLIYFHSRTSRLIIQDASIWSRHMPIRRQWKWKSLLERSWSRRLSCRGIFEILLSLSLFSLIFSFRRKEISETVNYVNWGTSKEYLKHRKQLVVLSLTPVLSCRWQSPRSFHRVYNTILRPLFRAVCQFSRIYNDTSLSLSVYTSAPHLWCEHSNLPVNFGADHGAGGGHRCSVNWSWYVEQTNFSHLHSWESALNRPRTTDFATRESVDD